MSEPVRPRIAFATCAAWSDLYPEDRELADAVAATGAEVVPAVWDDAAIDWSAFDLVLLRSTWDYHERLAEFRAWIERVGAVTQLRNPASVARWNTDKAYLRRLAEHGVPVVPTVWLDAGARVDLAALLAGQGWTEAIVKPKIGLGSSGLLRLRADAAGVLTPASGAAPATGDEGVPDDTAMRGDTPQAHLDALLAEGDAMVQPFLRSLEQDGELSMLFFGGAFSHALYKRPPAGEFRVQPYFGAVSVPATPSAVQRAVAEAVLAEVEEELLYARVDLVAGDDGAPLLMELELIEPALYFEADPAAAERFARVIADAVADPALR